MKLHDILNNKHYQKLLYQLLTDKESVFVTKKRLDFGNELITNQDFFNGNLLVDCPSSYHGENIKIFIKSFSMITGFDFKQLFSPRSDGDKLTGYFLKGESDDLTELNEHVVDLQSFINIYGLGTITLSSDKSFHEIDWNQKVQFDASL